MFCFSDRFCVRRTVPCSLHTISKNAHWACSTHGKFVTVFENASSRLGAQVSAKELSISVLDFSLATCTATSVHSTLSILVPLNAALAGLSAQLKYICSQFQGSSSLLHTPHLEFYHHLPALSHSLTTTSSFQHVSKSLPLRSRIDFLRTSTY